MPAIEVKEANTARERTQFIKMPWRLYRDDPHWVPPLIADQKQFLDPKRGVFYKHGQAQLFMAWRDGVPVGRISAHVNPLHEERFHDGKGFFGFFEAENDPEVARGPVRRGRGLAARPRQEGERGAALLRDLRRSRHARRRFRHRPLRDVRPQPALLRPAHRGRRLRQVGRLAGVVGPGRRLQARRPQDPQAQGAGPVPLRHHLPQRRPLEAAPRSGDRAGHL